MEITIKNNFNLIYSDYKEFVWNLTSKYFQNQWDREEAFQEIFIRVYQYLGRYQKKEQDYMKTWLYKVSITTLINHFKRQKRFHILKDMLYFNERLFFKGQPELVEEKETINSILVPLNAQQRAVVLLREIEELSYEEIAGIMEINIGTVKSMLNRARKKMKEHLERRGEDE